MRDSTVVMLFNADTPDGMRLGFACLNLQGDTLLQTIPGSGVDVAGEDIVWYGPNNFATIAATSDLGLGEGNGCFVDGPMAGYGKVVPHLVRNGMKRLLPSYTLRRSFVDDRCHGWLFQWPGRCVLGGGAIPSGGQQRNGNQRPG